MLKISENFRAGFEAAAGNEYTEANARAAWETYCGFSKDLVPDRFTPEEFAADWNKIIATISWMSKKHNLRAPDLIFHPEWLIRMRQMSGKYIIGTLIHMGVRSRFGRFEQATVLREG